MYIRNPRITEQQPAVFFNNKDMNIGIPEPLMFEKMFQELGVQTRIDKSTFTVIPYMAIRTNHGNIPVLALQDGPIQGIKQLLVNHDYTFGVRLFGVLDDSHLSTFQSLLSLNQHLSLSVSLIQDREGLINKLIEHHPVLPQIKQFLHRDSKHPWDRLQLSFPLSHIPVPPDNDTIYTCFISLERNGLPIYSQPVVRCQFSI